MKNIEIERKYLIKENNLPNLDNMNYMDITQGYIHDISNNLLFRLRQVIYMSHTGEMLGTDYFQTIKGLDGVERPKYEAQIWYSVFSKFWILCEKNSLHKFRYLIRRKDSSEFIHLDVYKNELKGLHTVDVEFHDNESANKYVPEEWFGTEITNNPLYANVYLAYKKKISE